MVGIAGWTVMMEAAQCRGCCRIDRYIGVISRTQETVAIVAREAAEEAFRGGYCETVRDAAL